MTKVEFQNQIPVSSIKLSFMYRDSHYKDKTFIDLIFIIGVPILGGGGGGGASEYKGTVLLAHAFSP